MSASGTTTPPASAQLSAGKREESALAPTPPDVEAGDANDASQGTAKEVAAAPAVADAFTDHASGYTSTINSFMFLGSNRAASDKEYMQSLGITHVLNMATRCPNAFEDEGVFTYRSMLLEDSLDTDIKSALGECISFIDEALASGGKVLVHCQAGVSRSATVVLAWLIQKKGMTLSEAWNYTVARRPVIRPNYSFMRQLMSWESECNGGVPSTWDSKQYMVDELKAVAIGKSEAQIRDILESHAWDFRKAARDARLFDF